MPALFVMLIGLVVYAALYGEFATAFAFVWQQRPGFLRLACADSSRRADCRGRDYSVCRLNLRRMIIIVYTLLIS